MRDIFDKEFVKEMDDFFDYIDGIIGRDEDEVDVITDHLPEPVKMTDEEADYLEQKAEIHYGIQGLETHRVQDTRSTNTYVDILRIRTINDIG